jgi:hypothetical protein
MLRGPLALFTAGSLALSACVQTRQVADVEFEPPRGDYSLIVMRPDVTVGLLTAGGLVEPRADWTEKARSNLLKALAEQQAGRGGRTRILETRAGIAEVSADQVADLERLHAAVGASIALHKYLGATLPTKRRQGLDWTLGEDAVAFGRATGMDYALFLHAEDSFASSGRVALQVLGIAGCLIGFCAPQGGGGQSAYASLVDLRTGEVVWFNVLQMVERLLGRMKAGRNVRARQ